MQIVVEFRDHLLSEYAKRLDRLSGGNGMDAMAAALNEGGAAVREQTVSAETAQTGLQHDTLDRAQQEIPASAGSLQYTIQSHGGNVRLKYFGAKEGGGGVTAHPWNRSTFYGGAWINSGFHGNRAPSPKLGGHVYRRTGAARLPITQVRSGLFIPTEMTQGKTASTFDAASASVLATTVLSRLGALLP